jgi:hypothetical protein
MDRRAVFFFCTVILATQLASDGLPRATGQAPTRLTPPPRELLLQLQRGQKAAADGQFSTAVRELGAVIAPAEDSDPEFKQDYFTAEGNSKSQLSLRAIAEKAIGNMPNEGRKLYELKYGAEAKALLDRAMEDFDLRALAECTRRYFHTPAGHDATLLLGQLHLDEGRSAAAAFCFRRLSESSRSAQYEPQASLLLSASWLYAGSDEGAKRTLLELKKRQPDLVVEAGDQKIKMFQNDADAIPWLRKLMSSSGIERHQFVEEWLTVRGNAERNALAHATPPVGIKSWRLPVANFPEDEEIISKHVRAMQSGGTVPMPSLHALAVGDQVIMRTTRRVFGVDFHTGKRVWEWPWDDEPDVDAEGLRNIRMAGEDTQWAAQLKTRLWSDHPFGQLSSNGKSVFAISNLGEIPSSSNQIMFALRNRGNLPSSNQLASLSLEREGALEWIIGGENGSDEPALAGTFFLGTPIADGDILYALAEQRDEVQLLALDPETGLLKWQQQLAHVEGMSVQSNPLRRMAGATPAHSSGVLVCPTAAGVVVAMDVSSRSLLWAYEYATSIKTGYPNQGFIGRPTTETPPEWRENSPIIHNGSVILAPPDSPWLYCLDLLSGESNWGPIKRNGHVFVGCVSGDQIVLVGPDKVTSIGLSNGGKELWTTPLPASPSGRGVNTGDRFLLPLSSSELLTLELSTGKIISTSKTEYMLGNLVSFRGHIVSHGANFLTTFHQVEQLREEAAARLSKNPDDSTGLKYQIILQLQDEKFSQALQTSLRAHKATPSNAPLRKLLTRSVLSAFDNDFENTHQLAETLGVFMEGQPEYGDYLRRLTTGYASIGDQARAFQSLLSFAAQANAERNQDDELVFEGGATLTSNDRWIRQKSAELLTTVKDSGDDKLLSQIKAQLTKSGGERLAEQDWVGLRRFLDQFSGSPEVARFQLALAHHYIDEGNYLRSELMLARINSATTHEQEGMKRALVAQLLMRSKQFEQAAPLFQELNQNWSDAIVWSEMTGSQLYDSVSADANFRNLASVDSWPNGQTKIATSTISPVVSRYPPIHYKKRTPVLTAAAAPFIRYVNSGVSPGVTLTNGSGRLVGRAIIPRSPRTLNSRSTNHNTISAHSLGHLIIISRGDDIFAVDGLGSTSGQNVLWNLPTTTSTDGRRLALSVKSTVHPWSGNKPHTIGPAIGPNLVGVIGPITPNGVCVTRHTNVVCLDPLTGEEQWVQRNVGEGCDLFGDDELLFVVKGQQAMVLRTLDGSVVGHRDVPSIAYRWDTFGRNLLTWKNETGKRLMRSARLYDAWSEKELWLATYSRSARGVVFDENKLAIFEPEDGILEVISMTDGQPIFQQHLPGAPTSLDHIEITSYGDRLLVMLNVTKRSEATTLEAPVPTNEIANGKLFAVNLQGDLLWPSPVVLDSYFVAQEQPTHSPIRIFHRNGQTANSAAKQYYSILAIDVRNGRPLFEEHIPKKHSAPVLSTVATDRNEVTVQFANFQRKVTFGDLPRPPSTPAITGDNAPVLDPIRSSAREPNLFSPGNFFPFRGKE